MNFPMQATVWYVERNGDRETRRKFHREELAIAYAEMIDRIHDDEPPCEIFETPVMEMIEESKAITTPENGAMLLFIRRRDVRLFLGVTACLLLVLFFVPMVDSLRATPGLRPFKRAPRYFVSPTLGMRLILIPGGDAIIGSSDHEKEAARNNCSNRNTSVMRIDSELPTKSVSVTSFYLSQFETTAREYRKFLSNSNHRPQSETSTRRASVAMGKVNGEWVRSPTHSFDRLGSVKSDDRLPAVNVSWRDGVAFCKWLSSQDGGTYRLPTEVEWEHACRAGTSTRWHSGQHPGDAMTKGWVSETAKGKPHRVGQYPPNGFGLYDMIGNAGEWVQDYFNDSSPSRVRKGGTFRSTVWSARSASRAETHETAVSSAYGFRVLREINDASQPGQSGDDVVHAR